MGAELMKLTRPSCGAKLEISQGSSQFLCGHCGSQYVLSRGTGAIEIKPIVEHLLEINTATSESALQTSRVALELELNRLERELDRRRKDKAEADSGSWKVAGIVGLIGGGVVYVASYNSHDFCIGFLFLAMFCWLVLRGVVGRALGQGIYQTECRIAETKVQIGV